MKNLIIAFGLMVGMSTLISCADEFDFSTDNLSTGIEQNSDFAVPLVNASITLEEILPNDTALNRYLIIDDNNFISMAFEYEFANYPAVDFFNGVFSGTSVPYIQETVGPQTVDLKLNEFINNGEFFLADPKIIITIKNYWDVPAQFHFTDSYYYEEENSAGLPITGDVFNTMFSINKPLTPGSFAITTIQMDNTNSNINAVISSMPYQLSFGALVETITTPPTPYSIDPNSTDSVKLKIEVPLDLRVTNLVKADTSSIDLTSSLGEDTSVVNSIQVNLIVQNGFPFSLGTQIYFADENYAILDSISNTEIFISSAITSAGKVTQSKESTNTILVENGKMSNLLKAKFLISKISFNTANAGSGETVKIYSDYKIGIKIGARIKLKIKT